ncbi:MAG: glycosyltransferase family 2 protein [Thermoanaerobaculia bacterium]
MISFVLVNYRSTALARRAIASFRAGAREAGADAEVVVVDNSCDAGDFAGTADRLVAPGRNLGFAGGLNAGAAAARGDVLFLGNPDLVFGGGSVGALADALSRAGDGAAAGPALFHDEGMSILLPPAEEPNPSELARRRLSMDPATAEGPFRRRLRRVLGAQAAAASGATLRAAALSGALVATTRRTLERVGPFDERYRLYYEENDWQRRLAARGGSLVYAAGTRVVHAWAQSTRQESRSAAWFAESERLYFGEHFGARGLRGLEALASAPAWPKPAPPLLEGALAWRPRGDAGIALSPQPWFGTFGWARLPRGVSMWTPPPGYVSLLPETCYVRAVDPATAEVLAEATLA